MIGRAPRRRPTLATRTTLVTIAVAAVAVVIAGLLSFGLVRSAAQNEAQLTLARQADVLAGLLDARRVRVPVQTDRLLRQQGIRLARVAPDGVASGDPLAVRALDGRVASLAADPRRLSYVADVGGERLLVEVRPLLAGGTVALAQRRAEAGGLAGAVLRRTMLALLGGLAVAAVAGALLARRLAAPLQRTAAAARRLASGHRDVRVEPEGPAEVAEVAEAVNSLAAALQVSEGRQREFLLSVSHELRTPLTGIKGFAESLADGVTTGADVAPAGRTILAESGRLERLVSDLLDLARLGAQDFRIDLTAVDLTDLMTHAGQVWQARCAGVGVRFQTELPPGPVVTVTDPTRLRQIVDGLAENALRVTPAGRPIVLALRAEGDAAVVEVRDGGPGLTPADLAVAFDRSVLYERYRGVRKVGTGVGLALVHGLASRLGGVAVAGRAPEGGACFAVRLPLHPPGLPAPLGLPAPPGLPAPLGLPAPPGAPSPPAPLGLPAPPGAPSPPTPLGQPAPPSRPAGPGG